MSIRRRTLYVIGGIITLLLVVTISFRLLSGSEGGNTLNKQQEQGNAPINNAELPIATEPDSQPEIKQGTQVKVDQVGYGTAHAKFAIVEGELPSGAEFSLVDSNGNTMFTGSLSEPLADAASQKTIRRADFSSFQTAGEYKLLVAGAGSSYPLSLEILHMMMRSLRCSDLIHCSVRA